MTFFFYVLDHVVGQKQPFPCKITNYTRISRTDTVSPMSRSLHRCSNRSSRSATNSSCNMVPLSVWYSSHRLQFLPLHQNEPLWFDTPSKEIELSLLQHTLNFFHVNTNCHTDWRLRSLTKHSLYGADFLYTFFKDHSHLTFLLLFWL